MYTIEELEKKSDIELNELVDEKEKVKLDKEFRRSLETKDIPESDIEFFCNPPKTIYSVTPNYCSSWADMGTIIENIWIKLNDTFYLDGYGDVRMWDYAIDFCGGRKLRAAAIVYLMMGGAV